MLRRALVAGGDAVRAGADDPAAVRALMLGILATEPLAMPDYVSVADPDTLDELETIAGRALLSLAVVIDGVRLIDNERVAQR